MDLVREFGNVEIRVDELSLDLRVQKSPRIHVEEFLIGVHVGETLSSHVEIEIMQL